MISWSVRHPSAMMAHGIESIILSGENSDSKLLKGSCALFSRVVSLTIFPVFLTLELFFKRIPKALLSLPSCRAPSVNGIPNKWQRNVDKIGKFALGILMTPGTLYSPDGISSFFLKRRPDHAIVPFGVEKEYGQAIVPIIHTPSTEEELIERFNEASTAGKQISVVGAGMSQGTQTVPDGSNGMIINTKNLNSISIDEAENTVTVGAGATWEQIQSALNEKGKSSIVKQASDVFSIGGSIGINCHGWAHAKGSISSTVKSLKVLTANGTIETLTPKDELFKCMFGTLGYFGIIVEATLEIVDNEELIETSHSVDIDQFHEEYEKIKEQEIPLFGGRLSLDALEGNPLSKVEMNCFTRLGKPSAPLTSNFTCERNRGTRLERIALFAIAQLPNGTVKKLLSRFWKSESKKMQSGRKTTRNEALHPPIKAFMALHHSNLHAQWLQEYFIKKENLPAFLRYLGKTLKANDVRLINATIRPTPKDTVSILPYAEQERYAVVICFAQRKTKKAIASSEKWMKEVLKHVVDNGDVYYQAYMPFATKEQFERCYGQNVKELRRLKNKYDPSHRFGNKHTAKYFD